MISEYTPQLPTVFNLDFGHTDPLAKGYISGKEFLESLRIFIDVVSDRRAGVIV